MLEHEWPRWLPEGMLFPVARVRLTGGSAEDYSRLAASAPEAARDLATAGVGVIAYACTLGSLFAGIEAEYRLIASLAGASKRPAIALASACADALRFVGARRLAIVTPYAAEANSWVADYAQAQGFEVGGFIATPMGIATVGDMAPAEVATLANEGLCNLPDADTLWMPCSAMQTMEAIEAIEAATGKAVVSGSQALLWKVLATLGIKDPIRGAGKLFS